MLETVFAVVFAAVSVVVTSVLASVGRKSIFVKLLNIPFGAAFTFGTFCLCLYLYSRIAHVPFGADIIFSDKVSAAVGAGVLLVISAVCGIILGAVQSRGIHRYMRILYGKKAFSYVGILMLLAFSVGALLICDAVFGVRDISGVVISEVCPHNFNVGHDSGENYSDYIELYNGGESDADLSELYLSDSEAEMDKFKLPEYILGAGEYVVIWADGSDTALKDGEIHCNFKLSDNETVILSTLSGRNLDTVALDVMPGNVSLTRVGERFIKAYGTPGRDNEDCRPYVAPVLNVPEFSLESGFYKEDVLLEIKAPRGCRVYYTLDGSVPDSTDTEYKGPVLLTDVSGMPDKYVDIKNTVTNYDNHEPKKETVEKANVVRAVAVNDKGEFSETVMGTYFIGDACDKYEGYSILSVVAEPDDLFGENGICVTGGEYDRWYNDTDRSEEAPEANFMKHGRMWERDAVVQLWDNGRELILDQNCGIRVQGNTARVYETKRFSFYAREHYSGEDRFDAEIFSGGYGTHSFYTRADKMDYVISSLVSDRELAAQDGVPVVVFLDGELYSVTYLREKHDKDYFFENYGIPPEDVIVISENQLDEGNAEDKAEYDRFIKLLNESDTTDPAIYEEIQEKMDVQSFIDFMAVNLYCNNLDIYASKNIRMWRSRNTGGEGYLDGRWRFATYDMDAVEWSYYARTDTPYLETDPFRWALNYDKYPEGEQNHIDVPYFENLLRNESFRNQFILTYLDIANETFSYEGSGGKSLLALGEEDNAFVISLLKNRRPYAMEHLKYAFDITEEVCEVKLCVNNGEGGRIRINTVVADTEDGDWTGEYISGLTVTLTAIPEEGYRFAGWKGDLAGTDTTVSVELTDGGADIEAVFEETGADG